MTEETEERSRDPMVVSLDLELSTLASAIRGAEILADLEIRRGLMDEDMERDAPESLLSILALAGGRFEQVRRVLRGEEDPARIWAPHNAVPVPESLDDVDGDVILFPWSAMGRPMVIARPSAWGLTPEEREARRALDLGDHKGKGPKGRTARKRATGKGPVPKAPSTPGGQPEGKEAAPEETPDSPGKGSKGSPPEAH